MAAIAIKVGVHGRNYVCAKDQALSHGDSYGACLFLCDHVAGSLLTTHRTLTPSPYSAGCWTMPGMNKGGASVCLWIQVVSCSRWDSGCLTEWPI